MAKLRLKGSGHYLPAQIVTSLALDEKMGVAAGTFAKASGVQSRHYASEEETPSFMGARAAMAALETADLRFSDLDLILGACGTPEQSIPCTAALIQKAMGHPDSGVPCFDINSTCLSFVTALQVASSFIEQGLYRNILIVSSEIASVGLNFKHLEAASLFGDGAAAFVVGPDQDDSKHTTELLGYHMETYSSGWDTCQIAGGGSKLHPSRLDWRLDPNDERFLFQMNGPKVFKLATKLLPGFLKKLEEKSGISLKAAKLFIPHQASESALKLICRKLDVEPERTAKIIGNHGNMIAASIPLALHYAIREKRLVTGDVVFLLGTSAGFSMGGMVIRI
jgi:3-oxoacyl-[acyl-carrier-protein] synthase-3